MEKIKKILVVIQPHQDAQPGLTRALELAETSNVHITAFLCVYHMSYDLSTILSMTDRESMRQAVLQEQKAWLKKLIASKKIDMDIPLQVEWHADTYQAVILFAMANQINMIIKTTRKHDALKSLIITPTDWHLIRKSPMPVLMVKEKHLDEAGRLICALNVSRDEAPYVELNHEMIKYAQLFAQQLNATVHLVNAYPGTPVNMAVELPDFDVHAYNESIRTEHQKRTPEYAEASTMALKSNAM